MGVARSLELALCAAQNSNWLDVPRRLQKGLMCRANNFRTLFRPYYSNHIRIQFLAIGMAPVPMPVFTPPPDGPSSDADVVSAIRY